MSVQKRIEIPNLSMLKREEMSFDYIDSFQSLFTDKEQKISIKKVLELFMSSGYKWADVRKTIESIIYGIEVETKMPIFQLKFVPLPFQPALPLTRRAGFPYKLQ